MAILIPETDVVAEAPKHSTRAFSYWYWYLLFYIARPVASVETSLTLSHPLATANNVFAQLNCMIEKYKPTTQSRFFQA